MVCLTDLPSSDAALVGQLFTKEMIANASTTPIIASIEDISSFRHANASSDNSDNSDHSDNSGANAFTVALSPRSWKYGTLVLFEQSTAVCLCVFFYFYFGHSFVICCFVLVSLCWTFNNNNPKKKTAAKGSRLPKKENWTFKPITNRLQAATFAAGVVVLFQVIVYARATPTSGGSGSSSGSSDQYLCLGAIRSPGFIVGSTRHLRRIAGNESHATSTKTSATKATKKKSATTTAQKKRSSSGTGTSTKVLVTSGNMKGSVTDEPLMKVPRYNKKT
jgi:hypothetical protein